MMNIRRVLAAAVIPFVIGTFNVVATNPAKAEVASHSKIAQQPHSSQNKLHRRYRQSQLKHHQTHLQHKKHHLQSHKGAEPAR